MSFQQVNVTFVQAFGTVFYAQPASSSWVDIELVEQETQGVIDQDAFSGMDQGNDQQTNQPIHYQWDQPMEDVNGYPAANHVVYPAAYSIDSTSSVEISGTTYFFPSFQGSSQSLHSMSSGYSSQDSSSSSQTSSTSFEEENQWIDNQQSTDVCLHNIKNLSSSEIRKLLESWTLTREEQDVAGYPSFDKFGRVQMQPTIWERESRIWIGDHESSRKCSRCSATFEVLANGSFPAGKRICRKTVKEQEKIHNFHVTNQRFISELQKFVSTPAPFGKDDPRSTQIYAVDAEMVMTIAGPALARVCVVGFDGHVEADILIKPEARVVDPLTEYSGVTMGMLEKATHTIESLHDVLFELINSQTILIGHGLESDLKAMRLVHHNVIDTAIMYRDEGRNKVALRTLAKTLLNRNIQQDNASTFGHNPEEDAVASLDLVKYKINYG